jgi:hypothetical protein
MVGDGRQDIMILRGQVSECPLLFAVAPGSPRDLGSAFGARVRRLREIVLGK